MWKSILLGKKKKKKYDFLKYKKTWKLAIFLKNEMKLTCWNNWRFYNSWLGKGGWGRRVTNRLDSPASEKQKIQCNTIVVAVDVATVGNVSIHLTGKHWTQFTFWKIQRKVLFDPYPSFLSLAFSLWLENRLLWLEWSIIHVEIRAKFKWPRWLIVLSLYFMVVI